MKQIKAAQLFEKAMKYCEENHPDDLAWAKSITPTTFKNLKSKKFLEEYCWVVYASGFKVAILKEYFPMIKSAFKDFDLAALSRMRSIKPVLAVFGSERKADCFLRAAK